MEPLQQIFLTNIADISWDLTACFLFSSSQHISWIFITDLLYLHADFFITFTADIAYPNTTFSFGPLQQIFFFLQSRSDVSWDL